MKTERPINTLITEFLSEQDIKEYVCKNQQWILNRFINWMVRNKIDVRKPRRANIIHYKNELVKEGKTPTTIETYLAPIRKFFAWLEMRDIYENIAAGIKSPPDDRQFRKDYLNPDQVKQLLELIPQNSLIGKRDYAIINLMLIYALRRIEILRLKVSDIKRIKGDMVLEIQRKGRAYKEQVLLHPEVFEPIENYLLARTGYQESDPLFANHSQHPKKDISEGMFSRIIKNYLKQISNSKKLTCHSLRHSTAINLLKSGKSIYDVQQLLSHRQVTTTELYLNAIKAEKRFNNPLTYDVIDIYKNGQKTVKNT